MTIPITATPFETLDIWLRDAETEELNDPTAACLATIGTDGFPDARMVLVRIINEQGFVFFSNAHSRKGEELAAQPKAALCFHWKTLRRSVRVQGNVVSATPEESNAYFNSRHISSRIGAWASLQSQPLDDRITLLQRFTEYEEKFSNMPNPPRPEHWHGFRIIPHRIEFWKDGEFRLHDRLLYIKNGSKWETSLLYP